MESLFKKNNSKKTSFLTVIYKNNNKKENRYLFTVSKKNGSAVIRNKIKRILRECIRKGTNINTKKGYDIGMIANRQILLKNKNEIKKFIEKIQ